MGAFVAGFVAVFVAAFFERGTPHLGRADASRFKSPQSGVATMRLTKPDDAAIKSVVKGAAGIMQAAGHNASNGASDSALGEAIAARLLELAAITDVPGHLTRLYPSPAHRKAADLVTG